MSRDYFDRAGQILRELNAFSLPLITNHFFNLLISMLLTAIIGRISMTAIASTEVIDGFMYSFIGILGVGTVAFNIQASRVRCSKIDEFYDLFKSIFILNLSIGLLSMLMTIMCSTFVLQKFYHFEGTTLYIGGIYAGVLSFSILFEMLIFATANLLKVMKKTGNILKIGMVSSVFQLVLSYIFVYHLFEGEYRVVGVALAGVLALAMQVFFYIFILRREFLRLNGIKSTKKVAILREALPLMLQEILEGGVFQILVMSLISRLGIREVSAYAVAVRASLLALAPMYIYCNALTVLVGENIGRKSLPLLPFVAMGSTLMFYVVSCLCMCAFREKMIRFYTDIPQVATYCQSILGYILFFGAFQIFFECSKYAFQSLGEEKKVLLFTSLVNSTMTVSLLFCESKGTLSLFIIVSILGLSYLTLGILFSYLYLKRALHKTVVNP